MLGKLLKHEWRATVRKYALFYLVLVSMTVFTAIIHAIPVENILFQMGEGAILVLYLVTLFGVMFCSTGMAVIRFYKNMVSDEGYLTFTLPARVEQLVFAKFLVAIVWQFVTVTLCILSLLCVFVLGHTEFKALLHEILSVVQSFEMIVPLCCVAIFFSMMYQMLTYYLSIAIGQLFGSYRILAAVIAYCAISFALELLAVLIILVIGGTAGIDKVGMLVGTIDGLTALLLFNVIWSIGFGIMAYIVICYLLKKKLNLD